MSDFDFPPELCSGRWWRCDNETETMRAGGGAPPEQMATRLWENVTFDLWLSIKCYIWLENISKETCKITPHGCFLCVSVYLIGVFVHW